MFMIVLSLDLTGIVSCCIRFFVCWITEGVKGGRFSYHRKMVWKDAVIYFGVTFLFFCLAFHM